jgi:molecular chaperone DnaK
MKNTFYGTKYFFGYKYSDEFITKLIKRFPYNITKGENDSIEFKTESGAVYTPSNVTSMYLKYVKEQADAFLGKPVKKVVMSVPKYITDKGKEELKESLKAAGLDVVKYLDESISAAYAYNLDEKAKNVIVFNLGGNNFSLTYLERNMEVKEDEDSYKVIYDMYDFYLGGDDIDKELTDFLLFQFKQQNKMDISNDPYALQRVREAAEQAKIELTLSQQVDIGIPFLAADEKGPKHLNVKMSRSKFENLIDGIITKIKRNCENFMLLNNINGIDEIILVGGISRIPRVQEVIKQVFGKEPNKSLNPEEAPALGAAIMTTKININTEEVKELETMPLSIGIETIGGLFTRLVPLGTPLPYKVTKAITTVYDKQPRVSLNFYLGERELAKDNKHIYTANVLTNVQDRGKAKVLVTISVDRQGEANITIKESDTKKTQSFNTKINTGLTQDVVIDILEQAQKEREIDQPVLDFTVVRIEADNTVNTLEKLIRDKKEEVRPFVDIDNAQVKLDYLKAALNQDRDDIILSSLESLFEETIGLDTFYKNNKI